MKTEGKWEKNWRKMLKGRNGGTWNDPIPNSLWKGMQDAVERRSGMKIQEHKSVEFPFPGASWAVPVGNPTFFPSHGSCFCQAPSQPNPSSAARWDFPVFPTGMWGSSKGNHTNPSFLQVKKFHLFSSQQRSGLGRKEIREWDWDTSPSNPAPGGMRVFQPQHIPSAHGRVTNLPEKGKQKKFGFAFNLLPPQGLSRENFPILVDLGMNPSAGRGRDGDEPQGRGENPRKWRVWNRILYFLIQQG